MVSHRFNGHDTCSFPRVKARRGEVVTARERRDLNDRLDHFMTRVNGSSNPLM